MKLKKLAVKMFSILLSVILLNTQFVFAARYQDVTEDLRYKNSSLARFGIPEAAI